MYLVTGEESGELGVFKTLREARKAIKEAEKFDLEELGEADVFTIEKVDYER